MTPFALFWERWRGVAGVLVTFGLLGLAYCAGTRDAETTRADTRAARADSIRTVRDTIRVAEYKVKTDTLYLRATRAEGDRRIENATVVMPAPTVPVVPRDTVDAVRAADKAASDSAIASLTALVNHYRQLDTLQSSPVAVEPVGARRVQFFVEGAYAPLDTVRWSGAVGVERRFRNRVAVVADVRQPFAKGETLRYTARARLYF
jgi:hypothetical protein